MNGISSINAAYLAGHETAKKAQKDSKTKAKRRTDRAPEKQETLVLAELPMARLVALANETLEKQEAVRPEIVEAVLARLDGGVYEDRRLLEALAEKLALLFHAGEAN